MAMVPQDWKVLHKNTMTQVDTGQEAVRKSLVDKFVDCRGAQKTC
jgi:hypothetical protein